MAADRTPFLAEVAARRATATRQPSVEVYLDLLESGGLPTEWAILTSLLTVKESYFFRGPLQLDALRDLVLPRLVAARAKERRLWLWSAACARGEEPSTLAILLAERPELADWNWRILATDLDAEALTAARRGLYGERALARVPVAERKRWFAPSGKLWQLAPELSARIEYRELNLARPPYRLPVQSFDVILLRNVLIYFRRSLQRRVADQVAQQLAPEGYLFLGGSETLWQVKSALEPVDLDGCFAYRHPGTEGTPKAAAQSGGRERAAPKLVAPTRVLVPAPPRPTPPAERSPQTAKVAPAAVPIAPKPLVAPLSESVAALAAGDLDAARGAAARAVEADPSDAATHALLGFIDDLAGRNDDALSSYRAALYLDPALFEVRLLLADCLGRLGHADRAAREYRDVLAALEGGKAPTLASRSAALAEVAFPDRVRAARRCRQVLGGGR